MKRCLAILLTVMLVVNIMPMGVFADDVIKTVPIETEETTVVQDLPQTPQEALPETSEQTPQEALPEIGEQAPQEVLPENSQKAELETTPAEELPKIIDEGKSDLEGVLSKDAFEVKQSEHQVLEVGKTLTLSLGSNVVATSYKWSIKYGSFDVTISSDKSAPETTVTGTDPGEVTIELEYEIDGKIHTKLFTITVVPSTGITSTEPGKFFILLPERGVPQGSASQGERNYVPSSVNNGGTAGLSQATGYKGTITPQGIISAGQNRDQFHPEGVPTDYYVLPTDLGFNNGKQVRWYAFKLQSDGYHIDGYIYNADTDVVYHSNYDLEKTFTDTVKTGAKYTVKTLAQTGFTQRNGYDFLGWSDNKNSTVANYAEGYVTPEDLKVGFDLYAVWKEKTITGVEVAGYVGEYDGKSHSATIVTKPDDVTVTFVGDNTITNVSEGTKTVTYEVTKAGFKTYTGTVTLKVNPKPVTITANNESSVYGELIKTDFTAVVGETVNGEKLEYTLSTDATAQSQTGLYKVAVNVAQSSNINSNYAITAVDGAYTITGASMENEVSAQDVEKEYDGTPLSITVNAPQGAKVEYAVENSLTNAGYLTVGYTVTKPNYTPVTGSAEIAISPKYITVSPQNSGSIYGEQLVLPDVIIYGVIPQDEHLFADKYSTTTSANSKSDSGTYEIQVIGEYKNDNYQIRFESATYTILKKEVTINVPTQEKKLGENFNGYNPEIIGLVNEDTLKFEITSEGEQATSVGTYPIVISLDKNADENKNYDITTTQGTIDVYAMLSYNANGATGTAPNETKFSHNSDPAAIADKGDLVLQDHIFTGWTTKQDSDEVMYSPTDKITLTKNTTLYAIWELDVIGEEEFENPDNIPDKYQVVFTYQSAGNGIVKTGGTAADTVKEAVTRYDDDGKLSLTASVVPTAASVVNTANLNYSFVNWSSTTENTATYYADIQAIKNTKFEKPAVFTANFAVTPVTPVPTPTPDPTPETAVVAYTLTYFVNGVPYATQLHTPGNPLALLGIPALAPGQVFSGWSALPAAMPENDVSVFGTITTPTVIADDEVPQGPTIDEDDTDTDTDTDIAPVVIPDDDVPQGPATISSSWALVNLLLAIATAVISLTLLVGYYFGKNKNENDEDTLKRKGFARIMSLIPAIAGVIAFILTENMSNPMVMVDKWTLLMAVIAVAQIVVCLFCKKTDEKTEQENA